MQHDAACSLIQRRERTASPIAVLGLAALLFSHLAAGAGLATVKVRKETLPLERLFDGTVEAVHQSTVSAQTSGRVQEILFDVGDRVPAGAVILRLVSTEQRQQLNQAEASLAEARANLKVETNNFQRAKELLGRQLIPRSEYDRAQGGYNAAKARVASAEAALKAARERLSYTEVRAPYGGIVSARHVELGEAVHPGTPLMSGFDPNKLRVETDLPQAVAAKVARLRRARVITGNGNAITPAQLILFPVADPATSTVRVRLELPEQSTGLYPGQFVKVAFTVGDTERLLVPASSIVHRSEVAGVYVVQGNDVSLRQIRPGNRFGDDVEVLAGLEAGEEVARDPVAAGIWIVNHRQQHGQ